MCLILLAWQAHPEYPLVVAANRDEFFGRHTTPAGFWPDQPDILAGRDLQAGGTWMGITRTGRFAALTNHRDPLLHRQDAKSRGTLVAEFLTGCCAPHTYLERLAREGADAYNGFNLLVGDAETLLWFSNVNGESRELVPGIYGLSNELLDTPWPKVEQSKSALAQAMKALPDDCRLFELLRDDTTFPQETLPRTGIDPEWERLLSAAFVRGPDYGTRGSTVLLKDRTATVVFDEQTWLEHGRPGPRHRFRFAPG